MLSTRRYVELVLRRRGVVVCICLLVTLVAGVIISRGVFASSMIKLFFGDSRAYVEYRQLADHFGETDFLFVGFDAPEALTAEGIAKLKRVGKSITATIPQVARVHSIATAYRVRAEDDTLDIRSYGSLVAEGVVDDRALRAELVGDERLTGVLVSRDGRSAAMVIELVRDDDRAIEHLPAVLDGVTAAFCDEGFERDGLHLAGLVAETVESAAQARFSVQRIFPFTAVLLIGVLYLLFLRLWPVVIGTCVALVSMAWTFAFAVLVDREINLMLAAVPSVMMIVALSDVVHLCAAYIQEIQGGLGKREAILRSCSEVGRACLFTSMTTFLGFVALAFVPTPIFRQLGIVLGSGVAIALFLALTLAPVFFSLIPEPAPPRHELARHVGSLLDGFTHACFRLANRRAWLVASVFAVGLVASVVGISRIEVEANMTERMAPGHPLRVAQDFIRTRFAGTNAVDLYLTAETDGALIEPAHFARIAALQDALEAWPEVDRALSLVDVMRVMHQQLGAGEGVDEGLPDSRALLAQYLLLLEMSDETEVERLIDMERRTMRMTLRLSGGGFVATAGLGEKAAQLAAAHLGPEIRAKPAGLTHLFGQWIEHIVAGQKKGLLFAVITTSLMMIWALRLVGAGVVSMLPNLLPLIFLGGYVGLAWRVVDSDTILIAIMAIGIGVDDTIHFLTRLRLEADRASSLADASHRAFRFAGRAIVQTTVVLCIGFAPFATSDYFSTRIMGTLLPMTLLTALFADLLLVPALLRLGVLRIPVGGDDFTEEMSRHCPAGVLAGKRSP